MPSVRVRRGSQYASLGGEDDTQDVPHRRPRSRTLASIYQPQSLFGQEASGSQNATLESGAEDQQQLGTRTFHSVRPTSKVAETILHGRPSQILRGEKGHSQEPSHGVGVHPRSMDSLRKRRDGTVVLEGAHADVAVPDDGRGPGILERTLSTASSSSSSTDPFRSSTEHEDDIVEHLDVIDPEISTVTNLANAANAILIPPIGVYSRKPVVFLPRIPVSGDAEGASVYEDDLDRHVEEVLSKRAKIRRSLRGVWAFVKTPLGIFTAIYGFCVVFWGAAIVFFLAKFINLHDPVKQGFWVEVSSQVTNAAETALFTVTGIGLIPWRVVDTYRILKIWRYKRLTRKLRKKAGLPELYDEDDLPDPIYDPNYVHVLTEEQEKDLHHQQRQFAKSQTWYRPHGTTTHRAFPIGTALIICCCNDGNSIFQIMLCATMWGLDRFQRPAWSTGILIPAAFLCGITAAVFIWRGGQKTKRTREIKEKLRLALKIERNPDKFRLVEAKKSGSLQSVDEEHAAYENSQVVSSPITDYGEVQDALRRGIDVADDHDPSILVEEKMEVPPSSSLR